jgi:hypothetical protein
MVKLESRYKMFKLKEALDQVAGSLTKSGSTPRQRSTSSPARP